MDISGSHETLTSSLTIVRCETLQLLALVLS